MRKEVLFGEVKYRGENLFSGPYDTSTGIFLRLDEGDLELVCSRDFLRSGASPPEFDLNPKIEVLEEAIALLQEYVDKKKVKK